MLRRIGVVAAWTGTVIWVAFVIAVLILPLVFSLIPGES